MAWETFPYSYTSPYIHSWIVEPLSLSFDPPHPTPTWPTPPLHDTPHPTPPLHDPPHPSLYDTPHPTPSWPTHPTPPYPTPSWPHPTPSWHTPPYPTPPHPFMTHPTHPFMTHPPHPTPPFHDPPTPPHPFMTHPPLVHFWAQRSLFSWAASLCLPSVDNNAWFSDCWWCKCMCSVPRRDPFGMKTQYRKGTSSLYQCTSLHNCRV